MNTINYASASAFSMFDEDAGYASPHPLVSRIATATTTSNTILPVEAPFSDSSYSMTFYGASAKCDLANSSALSTINSMLYNMTATFVAFVPEAVGENVFTSFTSSFGTSGQLWLGKVSQDDASNEIVKGVVCQLYNSSYTVDFNFTQNLLSINVRQFERFEPLGRLVPPPGTMDGKVRRQTLGQMTAAQTIGTAMGATWDALGAVLVGRVTVEMEAQRAWYTMIMQTKIINGPDGDIGNANFDFSRLNLHPNLTLEAGVEELIQNITLSLFSQATLL